jgi:branched-subunit amino acid aminotransferase/4-amino-4-deoxychorismate lyase
MMEINGRQAGAEDLRALALCNYGHFTSMRVEGMRVRGLSLHMERLSRDARALFGADLDTDRVRHLVRGYAERAASPAIVRVTVFDAGGGIDRPGGTQHPDILVSSRHAPESPLAPLRVESVSYVRELPAVKHVGLLGPMALRRAAQQRGYDDALFTDEHSHVSEGPTWNIGFFDGSQVIWPKADVLPGVTVALVKGLTAGSGIASAEEGIVHLSQVSETWTAFATNASVGVRPVQAIDGVELLDSSPVIRNLQLQYARIPGEPL